MFSRWSVSIATTFLITLSPLINRGLAAVAGDACNTFNYTTLIGPVDPPWFHDEFASDLAGSDTTLVVGSRIDGYPSPQTHGALFVYTRSNAFWSFQQKLVASDEIRFLGASVAIDGNTIVAGVPEAAVDGSSVGVAYVFERIGTNWVQQQRIHALTGGHNQYFGYAVAIHGDTILVGAPGEDNITGAAYVFMRQGTNWNQQARLIASDRQARDGFGWSVSTDGKSLLVGSSAHGFETGGVGYVFEQTTNGWIEAGILIPPKTRLINQAIVVSISGNWAAINHQESPRGVDLFHRGPDKWEIQQTLKADNPILEGGFGHTFALNGSRLAIGSTSQTAYGTNTQPVVYVYQYDDAVWGKTQLLNSGVPPNVRSFGRKVALSESAVFVSSTGRAVVSSTYGIVYAFDSDVEPPIIHSTKAKPNVLFPPNNKMRPVEILVNATDDCGSVSCRITSVTVKDGSQTARRPASVGDWKITGELSALLRATPSRHKTDRLYTIHIECRDEAGNISNSSVDVTVPHHRQKTKDWRKYIQGRNK